MLQAFDQTCCLPLDLSNSTTRFFRELAWNCEHCSRSRHIHSDVRYNNIFCFLLYSFPTKSNHSISSCDLYGALCSDIHRATYPNPSISISSELTIVDVNLGTGFLICLIGLLPAVDFISISSYRHAILPDYDTCINQLYPSSWYRLVLSADRHSLSCSSSSPNRFKDLNTLRSVCWPPTSWFLSSHQFFMREPPVPCSSLSEKFWVKTLLLWCLPAVWNYF